MPGQPEVEFVQRVGRYPVVNDAYAKVADYYTWAKGSNALINTGLNLTESALNVALSTAQPVVRKLDSQISSIDQFSCRQLDKIEKKYPIVLEPTEEVMDKTKDLYDSVVKPRVERVMKPVVTPMVYTIHGVSNGISSVKRRSASVAMSLTETRGGQVLISRLHDALDLADRSFDRILPPSETGDDVSKDDSAVPDSTEPSDGRVAEKKKIPISQAVALTTKVRRRMYNRAMNDLKHLRLRSEDALKKMTHSVDLIAYARTHMDNAKTYGLDLDSEWRNAMLELEEKDKSVDNDEGVPEEVDEICDDDSDDEPVIRGKGSTDRLFNSARYWAHRLRIATSAAAMVTYRRLPKHMQERLDKAQSYSNDLHKMFQQSSRVQDLKESFIDTARKTIQTINDNLDTVFDYVKESSLMSWLYPKESSEYIKMQTLKVPNRGSESKPTDSPRRPMSEPSPATRSQQSQPPESSIEGENSPPAPDDSADNVPIVSDDDELE